MESAKSKRKPVQTEFLVLFQLVRDISVEYFNAQLEEMFRKVEPVFIDFASKADTNNSQAYFFESITEINQNKHEVFDWFIAELLRDFERFSEGLSVSNHHFQVGSGNEELLKIIEDEDLELHLAMVNMATKLKNQCHQDLYQIGQRFSVLFKGQRIPEVDNPIGPTNISRIFHAASNIFDLDKERLLICYILFEKTVMVELPALYNRLNEVLINAGIYPNIWAPKASALEAKGPAEGAKLNENPRRDFRRPSSPVAPYAQPVSEEDFELGGMVFEAIFSFLTEKRKADPRFKSHIEYQAEGDKSQLKGKPELIEAIEIMHSTAQVHSLADRESGADGQGLGNRSISHVKKRITAEREGLYRKLNENTIPMVDLDTIDLVGMLFEEVLNDENLANITKALICHLHTLYLKVAVLDTQFLADTNHVARRFLNLVVLAGRDWIDEAKLEQGLYKSMEKMIISLMHSFENSVDIFEHYQEMLQAEIEQLQKRAKVTEHRTREVTKGKDRLEFARKHANEVIEKNLEGDYIHPVLGDFLYHEWKDCITMMLLRNPKVESTKEWRSVLMVIHSLSKISRTRGDLDNGGWLKNVMPVLKKHIDHVLGYLGDDHRSHSEALFQLLEDWSSGRFDRRALAKKAHFSENSSENAAEHSFDESKLVAEDRQILAELKQLEFGTWFEFVGADEEKRRVKLSWYSPITHKHMFTDRFGAKAYIIPTPVLIQKVKDGTAREIDLRDLPFVDKALLKIHSALNSQ